MEVDNDYTVPQSPFVSHRPRLPPRSLLGGVLWRRLITVVLVSNFSPEKLLLEYSLLCFSWISS